MDVMVDPSAQDLSSLELRQATIDGDLAGGHETAVRRGKKAATAPISAGSAMGLSGIILTT